MSPSPTLYGSRQARQAPADDGFRPLLGGAPSLDFANTVERHNDPTADDDLGSGYVRLLEWSRHAGAIDDDTARALQALAGDDPRAAAAVRRRAHALRTALAAILCGLTSNRGIPREPVAVLDAEIREARLRESLRVSDHGLAWKLDRPLTLEAPLQAIARDAADLLTSDRASRIRQCASPECERFFLDSSRNGSRQFCSSSGCGSRIRVQRFRERQRRHD